MSWLSAALRKTSLGTAIANSFSGLESGVTAAVVATPPVQDLQHVAITDIGDKAKQLVENKIDQAVPGAQTITNEMADTLFAALETVLEQLLQHAEGTTVVSDATSPPKT